MICNIYILLPCFCVILPRFCSVFNKTALLSANPQIQEFFFMFIIMMKDWLQSNNSLSSETVSVYFFSRKKIHMHTDSQYITKMLLKD